jgi:hypothetical protein
MSTPARPALARTLLRASKRAGTDAAQSQDDAGWQRTERAVSRGLGRVGHWADARNPDGMRRLTGSGRWWLVAAGGAVLAALVVTSRRRQGHA